MARQDNILDLVEFAVSRLENSFFEECLVTDEILTLESSVHSLHSDDCPRNGRFVTRTEIIEALREALKGAK